MNPISETAFYSCGVRMLDARHRRPICNDVYAERFMDHHGHEILQRFGAERDPNLTNVVRHRHIDDELRRSLAADPKLRVVLIGCGFDTRAFRLKGGEWFELDEPPLIAAKNEKLPIAECANTLVRVPIEFATEPLTTKLGAYADARPTLEIICQMDVSHLSIDLAQLEQLIHFGEARALVDEASLALDGGGAVLCLRMCLNR